MSGEKVTLEHVVEVFSKDLLEAICAICEKDGPRLAGDFLMGVIINSAGNIPDEQWPDVMRSEPCGKRGCDCHVVKAGLFEALNKARAHHQKHFQHTHVIEKQSN